MEITISISEDLQPTLDRIASGQGKTSESYLSVFTEAYLKKELLAYLFSKINANTASDIVKIETVVDSTLSNLTETPAGTPTETEIA